MKHLRMLACHCAGVAAVEFALLSPVFIGFMLLLVAGAGMEWTQQVLEETAQNTARCMSVDTVNCGSISATQTYATTRASINGVLITSATVTPSTNQTCNGVSGMNQVVISMPYQPMAGPLYTGSITLTATACYPTIS